MKKFNPIFMWYVSAIVFYVITLYKLITEYNALLWMQREQKCKEKDSKIEEEKAN